MNARQRKISDRVTVLSDRLRRLEGRKPEPHERPIVEVGILFLRETISRLGRQIGRAV